MTTPSTDPTVTEVEAVATAVIAGQVPMADLPAFFDQSFTELGRACGTQGIVPTGAAFARYHGAPAEVVDLEVGLPVDSPVRAEGRVAPGSLPAGRVAAVSHHGGYDGLGAAWAGLGEWIEEQGLTPTDTLWEVYVTEPGPDVDPATLRTDLFWAITG